MKKFTLKNLLATAALLVAGSAFAAQSVSQDFTTNDMGLPTKNAKEESTVTTETGTWTIFNAKYNSYGDGSLMVYGTDGYVILPTVDFVVGSIDVTIQKGASAALKIALYAGDELVKEVAINANAEAQKETFLLQNQTAGTVYKLLTTNKNAQYANITINEVSAEPAIIADKTTLAFGAGLNGTTSQSINVVGSNLSGEIAVAFTGEQASMFSAEPATLPAEGGALSVTFTAGAAGTAQAVLTLTSGEKTVEVPMSAIVAAHAGTEADPLDVQDVITLNNTAAGPFWVKGTIKGCAANGGALSEADAVASNIALGEEGVETYIPVELKSNTEIRTALNLLDNPGNLNKTVSVYGELTGYFSYTGVKNVTEYKLDDSAVKGVEAAAVNVTAYAGNIYVAGNGEAVAVYNIAGAKVADGVADGSAIAVNAKGVMIVKAGSTVVKTIVK